jgi:hypothetical protein
VDRNGLPGVDKTQESLSHWELDAGVGGPFRKKVKSHPRTMGHQLFVADGRPRSGPPVAPRETHYESQIVKELAQCGKTSSIQPPRLPSAPWDQKPKICNFGDLRVEMTDRLMALTLQKNLKLTEFNTVHAQESRFHWSFAVRSCKVIHRFYREKGFMS